MSKQIIYWDSDAFLGLINKDEEPNKFGPCEDVWIAGQRGMLQIVTSTLTLAEVIYKKGTPKLDPSKRNLVNNFFRSPHIVQRPLTRAIAELARDVVWDYNIKPKDAIHIATAAYYKISEVHTFDKALLGQGTVLINGFLLTMQEPHALRQLEIPI